MLYNRITEQSREIAEPFIEYSFGIGKKAPMPENSCVIVMTDEEADVEAGFMAVDFADNVVFLRNIYMMENYRARGYGSEFIDELKILTIQSGRDILMFSTSVMYSGGDEALEFLESIISFFEKQGFFISRSADMDAEHNENRVAVGILVLK